MNYDQAIMRAIEKKVEVVLTSSKTGHLIMWL